MKKYTLVAACLVLASLGLAQTVATSTAQTICSDPTCFLSGLADITTSEIVVTRDISLTEKDWAARLSQQTLNLTRNLLVRSQDDIHYIINFNYLQQKIHIPPGITLHFKTLNIKNTRHGPGYNVDFIDYSPGGVIFLEDTYKEQDVCMMFNLDTILNAAVPDSYPADINKNVTVDQRHCLEGRCWDKVLVYHTYAVAGVHTVDQNSNEGGYVIAKQMAFKVCNYWVPDSCVQAHGAERCVLEAMDALEYGQQHDRYLPLKIALPVCMAVLLATAAAALVLWRRARRCQTMSNSSTETAANKGTGAAAKKSLSADSYDALGNNHMKHLDSFEYDTTNNLCQFLTPVRGPNDGISMGSQQGPNGSGRSVPDFQPCMYHGRTKDGQEFFMEVFGMPIGQGSFGKVYKGHWNGLPVAIKVVQHSTSSLDSVSNEISLLMSFKHTNVVQAYHYVNKSRPGKTGDFSNQTTGAVGHGSISTNPLSDNSSTGPPLGLMDSANSMPSDVVETWIICEFCDQGALSSLLTRKVFLRGGKPMLRPLLLRLVDIAQGMAYLHEQKVCHGDLKCPNVLLATNRADPYGLVAKVSDFGLSRAMKDGQTHLSTCTVGTVTHMPPELLRNGKLSPPGDVYAFGIMMWELVTGVPPYKGMMYGEIIEKVVVSGKRPSFPEFVPKAYRNLAQDCWQADPNMRPAFTDVIQRLNQMLHDVQQLQAEVEDAIIVDIPSSLSPHGSAGIEKLNGASTPDDAHASRDAAVDK